MSNILLVLSPLDSGTLHTQTAAELAISLKNQGAIRVDLTADSHYSEGQSHGNYAVSSFTYAASNVAQIMGTVIGESRMYDLPAAMDRSVVPTPGSLLQVSLNCLRATVGENHNLDRADARALAVVFYAAIHAGQYDRVMFPRMSDRAQKALFIIGHNLRGLDTGQYGRPIHLTNMRQRIFDLCGVRGAPKGQRLN